MGKTIKRKKKNVSNSRHLPEKRRIERSKDDEGIQSEEESVSGSDDGSDEEMCEAEPLDDDIAPRKSQKTNNDQASYRSNKTARSRDRQLRGGGRGSSLRSDGKENSRNSSRKTNSDRKDKEKRRREDAEQATPSNKASKVRKGGYGNNEEPDEREERDDRSLDNGVIMTSGFDRNKNESHERQRDTTKKTSSITGRKPATLSNQNKESEGIRGKSGEKSRKSVGATSTLNSSGNSGSLDVPEAVEILHSLAKDTSAETKKEAMQFDQLEINKVENFVRRTIFRQKKMIYQDTELAVGSKLYQIMKEKYLLGTDTSRQMYDKWTESQVQNWWNSGMKDVVRRTVTRRWHNAKTELKKDFQSKSGHHASKKRMWHLLVG